MQVFFSNVHHFFIIITSMKMFVHSSELPSAVKFGLWTRKVGVEYEWGCFYRHTAHSFFFRVESTPRKTVGTVLCEMSQWHSLWQEMLLLNCLCVFFFNANPQTSSIPSLNNHILKKGKLSNISKKAVVYENSSLENASFIINYQWINLLHIKLSAGVIQPSVINTTTNFIMTWSSFTR